ncbi:MAG: CoA ester lyase [Nocardioides sp.]|uniref:HpcH/HpaI aldolase/citrate lyase family protein n=1 Tax=Nocardioides sp. TaxID=35761 RepID=UPI0039E2AA5C
MFCESTGRRSVLCVPGDDPRMIEKALASGADEVVIDFEDAVAADRKVRARESLGAVAWPDDLPRVAVRINAPRTPWSHGDVIAVAESGAPIGTLVLPKAESRADVGFVERLLDGLGASGVGIQALVETAAGLTGLADLTSARERLTSLIIGYADLAASLGRPSASDWRWAQETLLAHGRAAGLELVDGPWLGVQVDDAFTAAVTAAASIGFDAKWVIHPRQVAIVNALMAPAAADVERARQVLAAITDAQASGVGAIRLGSELVDEAMAVAARRVLAKASR